MKKLILFLFLIISFVGYSQTYYNGTRIFTGSLQVATGANLNFKGTTINAVKTGDTIATSYWVRLLIASVVDTTNEIATKYWSNVTFLPLTGTAANSNLAFGKDSIYIKANWGGSFIYTQNLTSDISWQSDVSGARSVGFGDYTGLDHFYAVGSGDYNPYIFFNSGIGISAIGNDSVALNVGLNGSYSDNRVNPSGIGYAANYHRYLDSLSWVDKSYVDSISRYDYLIADTTFRATDTTALTVLLSDTIEANQLKYEGDRVNAYYFGQSNMHVSVKDLTFYIKVGEDSTIAFGFLNATGSDEYTISVVAIRARPNLLRASVTITTSSDAASRPWYSDINFDPSNKIIFTIRGICENKLGSINAQHGYVDYFSNPKKVH